MIAVLCRSGPRRGEAGTARLLPAVVRVATGATADNASGWPWLPDGTAGGNSRRLRKMADDNAWTVDVEKVSDEHGRSGEIRRYQRADLERVLRRKAA